MVLAFHDYLGRKSKSDLTHIVNSRLKFVKAVRASLLEFFDNVDKLNIPSLNYEDSIKAQAGKLALRQRIEDAINLSTYPDTEAL